MIRQTILTLGLAVTTLVGAATAQNTGDWYY